MLTQPGELTNPWIWGGHQHVKYEDNPPNSISLNSYIEFW